MTTENIDTKEVARRFLKDADIPETTKPTPGIEKRIANATDYDTVFEIWRDTEEHSSDEILCEKRLAELNTACDDYQEIMRRWNNTNPCGALEYQLEERMIEIVNSIDPSNVPRWAKTLLAGGEKAIAVERLIPHWVALARRILARQFY